MYLRRRFYLLLLAVALIAGLGYAYAPLFTVGRLLTLALFLATIADIALLWHRRAITAERLLSTRFSNGDDNPVTINVESTYLTPPSVPLVVASIPSATSSSTLPPVSASSSAVTAVPPPATSASIPRSSVCTSTS